jgi:hypothetical protein
MLSGRASPKPTAAAPGVRHLPVYELMFVTWLPDDKLATDIYDRGVLGLERGDRCTFDKHKLPVLGDVGLAIFAQPPAVLVRRFLPGPGSSFQLLADDGSRRTHPRSHLAPDRQPARPLHARRMRQLPQKRRLRFHLN